MSCSETKKEKEEGEKKDQRAENVDIIYSHVDNTIIIK
jgi:hypothetical protein